MERSDFIREIVKADNASGKHGGRVATRFPPEPNGYLHIGHAKSICLNFGIAEDFGGTCNLRFDDTNPETEDTEYVESIQEDVRWLGASWEDRLYYASDYFEKLYECAEMLINKGLAYVDDQTADEIRQSSRHPEGARPQQPESRSVRGRESRPVPPHARRRVPRRLARAAREDRHGVAEHQHARPDPLSHPARASSSDRRRVVHLSDVRLRASDLGRARAHHALDLHARVRRSPARSTTGW